jgi:PBP1b-binding outer membrane lipoprotein LpoB
MKKAILVASLIIAFLFAQGCCKHGPKDNADQTRNNTTVNTNHVVGSLL